MGQFPLARIFDFVAKVFPFDTLEQDELEKSIKLMEIAYFPRGRIIIKAGGDPADHLFIIHSGSVKISVPAGPEEEFLVDIRGEGDMFGAVSLLQSRKALFTVTAQEDLLTFLLPAEEFRRLVEDKPIFHRHFSMSLARNIRAVQESADGLRPGLSGHDSLKDMAAQMRGRVADLMSADVLTCPPEVSIREAALRMTRRRVGSVVVTDPAGRPLGLVTDTDLRVRVLAEGIAPERPVSEIMSRPPLSISSQAYAFEAILDMTRHGVHHLLVTEGEHMTGVISDHDIKVVTGSTPVGLAREIDNVLSLEELTRVPSHIRRVLEMLLNLGSSAEYMMDLLSEFADRLYLKLFALCEDRMEAEGLGRAPTGYCWLALGRAGRREQAPPLHQDHALVYSDVPEQREGVVREWFIGFARRVEEGALLCQFPAGMASPFNGAGWCRSAGAWRRTYLDWVRNPATLAPGDPGHVFDFRSVQGESAFAVSLREAVTAAVRDTPDFLGLMAASATAIKPPLGFLRRHVVGHDGSYSDWLNLEEHGLRLLASAVRVLAMEQGLTDTNTLGRLREAAGRMSLSKRLEDDLREVFSFMTVLNVSHYLQSPSPVKEGDDLLNPNRLTTTQRRMLKQGFKVIAELQELVVKRYSSGAGRPRRPRA
jgi:CBS domain-containing protein